MEAVVDASSMGVIPQLWMPIRLDWDALKQSAEENGSCMHNCDNHQCPDDPEDSVMVAAYSQEED